MPRLTALYTNQVYRRTMSRTNLDIDDELVARVMKRYGLTTKKEAVDYALRSLAGRLLSREEILAYHGAGLIEFPVDDNDTSDDVQ